MPSAPRTHCTRGHLLLEAYCQGRTRRCPQCHTARMRTHCTRGHDLSDAYVIRGHRRCRTCAADQARARRATARPHTEGVMRSGPNQVVWAVRRARYGPKGLSPAGREKVAASCRLVAHGLRQRTHCRRGHPFSAANTRWVRGQRTCRTCRNLARRLRPSWVAVEGGRLSIVAHDQFYRRRRAELRSILIAAHPDKGGTPAKFIQAKRILDRFLATEGTWYATYGLRPPSRRAHDAPQTVVVRDLARECRVVTN
jgi:hypothetical protein